MVSQILFQQKVIQETKLSNHWGGGGGTWSCKIGKVVNKEENTRDSDE